MSNHGCGPDLPLVLGASPTCSFRSCLMASSPLDGEPACSSRSFRSPSSFFLAATARRVCFLSSSLQFRLAFAELGEASNMCLQGRAALGSLPGPVCTTTEGGLPIPGLQGRNQSFHEARKWWRKEGMPAGPAPLPSLPAMGYLPLELPPLFFIPCSSRA